MEMVLEPLEEAGLPVARRRRRFPRLIIDRETTINDGDFSAQRRDYADTMRFQVGLKTMEMDAKRN